MSLIQKVGGWSVAYLEVGNLSGCRAAARIVLPPFERSRPVANSVVALSSVPKNRSAFTCGFGRRANKRHRHPEQGLRACLGILRLARSYGSARIEAACRRGNDIGATTYGSIKSILQHGLDRAYANERPPDGRQSNTATNFLAERMVVEVHLQSFAHRRLIP
jgi:hypothetical protein